MNKPREKWVNLTTLECPCKYRFNLERGDGAIKLCAYHEKIGNRWVEWNTRPAADSPEKDAPGEVLDADDTPAA